MDERWKFIDGMSARLAVILSHPTQYYSPWFRWLTAHTDVKLRVFYLWDFGVTVQRDRQFEAAFRWDIDLTSGYDHEFIRNESRTPGTHHFGGLNNPDLNARLRNWAPDAMLMFGYKSESHLSALMYARAAGIPLIFRGDSHFLGGRKPSLAQTLILQLMYAQFAAFLPVGYANADYFRQLGVPPHKMHFAPHAVDQSLYQRTPEREAAAATLRARLGIEPDASVVLYAGKFVPEKQPSELLRAFLELKAPTAYLVYVGDGPLRPELEKLAAQPASARVRFLPFANQSEMPVRYLMADIFVLPSRGLYETWGLAVNEAMHLGVPALVSDRVGCQQDLVSHGRTGWVFAAEDERSLRLTLQSALQSVVTDRHAWRKRAIERVSRYSFAKAADGLLAALTALCQRPRRTD